MNKVSRPMQFLGGRHRAAVLWNTAVVALGLMSLCPASALSGAAMAPGGEGQESMPGLLKLGVTVNGPKAFQGYTLVFPFSSTKTYLIDMQGKVVRKWDSKYTPGEVAFLEENGHLLRAAKLRDSEAIFAGAGPGGRIQKFTWEGKLIWDYKFHNERQIQHHAITRMPNGNIMMMVWERKTPKETLAAGVRPDTSTKFDMLVDSLIEITPMGLTGGKIAWEWHLWDHLVQDHEPSKPNYGDVAAHPELIDANCARGSGLAFGNLGRGIQGPPASKSKGGDKDGQKTAGTTKDNLDRLKGIGYIGAGGGTKKFLGYIADWTHVNAVSYNAKLDQIMLSSREFSEIWVIDHSTTTAEAKGHTGGRNGKGGDLLYRWGNPANYRAETAADRKLFHQHDAHWIPDGLPGAGNVLLFNNGPRPDGDYSTVDEIVLPADADGRYQLKPGKAFGPVQPLWSYSAPKKTDFFGRFMSGAQRLSNGNTLAATGFTGTIVEVTTDKEVVWNYAVPPDVRPKPGSQSGPTLSVQLVSNFLAAARVSQEKKKELEALDREASAALDKLLTEEQRKRHADFRSRPGASVELGQVMPVPVRNWLRLTPEQKSQVDQLQKDASAKLGKILTSEQLRAAFSQLQTTKLFSGPGTAAIFRAYRYGPNYPGLAGKELTPGQDD